MLERYTPMLNAIKALDSTAHIGGGAVRDSLLERPIKDIDLFLNVAHVDEAAGLMRSQFGYVKVGEWVQYEMFSDPVVARLAKFEKADETIPVCLIGLNETHGMRENLRRFDFGICMAAWNGSEVYVAPEYKRDVESKTFTLCRADNQPQYNYSFSRFQKLTADRYAGWELVVPNEFLELARGHGFREGYYSYSETGDLKFLAVAGVHGQQRLTPKAR